MEKDISKTTEIKVDEIKIDQKRVEQFMGYSSRKMPENLKEIMEGEIEKKDVFSPRLFIREVDEKMLCENGILVPVVKKHLSDSDRVFSIIYTIGDEIDLKITEYMSSNDMIRGMFLDKIGVVALDYIKSQAKEYIEKSTGLNIVHQVYPGNTDFDAEKQLGIYGLFDGEVNDYININEYGQMSPIKSVAFLVFLR